MHKPLIHKNFVPIVGERLSVIVHPVDKKTGTWFLEGNGSNIMNQVYVRSAEEPVLSLKMEPKNYLFSKNAKIAFCIIVVLVVINAIWFFFQNFSGPIFALIAYAIIAFLFLVKKEFMAGIIAGTGGLFVHIYELIFLGLAGLTDIGVVFLLANIFFPIPLIVFSFKAYQELKHER